MKTGTIYVNEEREKVSPVNSSSNAEPGYSKKPQNEDLINSISALINTRLTEFRSEMKHLDKQKWKSTNVFRR